MLRPFFFFIILIFILMGQGVLYAGSGQWQALKTRYLNLYFQTLADLETFDQKIAPVRYSARFSGFTSGSQGPHGPLADKVDGLVEKVQLILDMHKPIRIDIRIYPEKKALQDHYFSVYKKRRNIRAWYVFEENTIYLSVEDLFSGMLAHEIAHAIIDHFLAVRPPPGPQRKSWPGMWMPI